VSRFVSREVGIRVISLPDPRGPLGAPADEKDAEAMIARVIEALKLAVGPILRERGFDLVIDGEFA
jgi:hypothetical protein